MFPRPPRMLRLIIFCFGLAILAFTTYLVSLFSNPTPSSTFVTKSWKEDSLQWFAPKSDYIFQNVRFESLQKIQTATVDENLDGIETINFHNFDYIHNPSNLCRRFTRVLVYIHSSPVNLKRRQAIRQTWGHPKILSSFNATMMFVLGRVLNSTIQSLIDLEVEQYEDILQEDFVDSYKNLTYKGLAGLKWTQKFCSHIQFLLKTDDDILLDFLSYMKHLYTKVLPSRGTYTKLVLCNVWIRMRVMRDPKSKWYVSQEEFPEDFFPAYCSGSAFLISGDLIPGLYHAAARTPFFWVDDCYLTGFLAGKLNVVHTRLNSAYLLNPNIAEEKIEGDTSGELMIFHIKKLSMFHKLWLMLMGRHHDLQASLLWPESEIAAWIHSRRSGVTADNSSVSSVNVA